MHLDASGRTTVARPAAQRRAVAARWLTPQRPGRWAPQAARRQHRAPANNGRQVNICGGDFRHIRDCFNDWKRQPLVYRSAIYGW
ncbi:hypothetical protein F6X42_06600 [Paraburkholderia sp. WC7.3b]|uniref:Uncharacterized protein n=1 Tax=Paraburkholderia podalyriae TaxID=1938811 RepID=A0ABR7PIW0_9BURK|nr:hypothetical protein [Paraburkholderia podalyriae]